MIRVALIGAKYAIFSTIFISLGFILSITYNTLTYTPRIEPKPIVITNVDTSWYTQPILEGSLAWEAREKIIEKYKQ